MEVYEDVKTQVYNGNIYCFCRFERKDIVKNLGFKFDGDLKLWYLPANKLTKDIFEATQIIRFRNFTTVGPLNYYHVYYQSITSLEYKLK
jgi:hypothetical protein